MEKLRQIIREWLSVDYRADSVLEAFQISNERIIERQRLITNTVQKLVGEISIIQEQLETRKSENEQKLQKLLDRMMKLEPCIEEIE